MRLFHFPFDKLRMTVRNDVNHYCSVIARSAATKQSLTCIVKMVVLIYKNYQYLLLQLKMKAFGGVVISHHYRVSSYVYQRKFFVTIVLF